MILEIEIQGAMKVKEKIPGSTSGIRNFAYCGRTGKTFKRQRNKTAQVIAERLARAGEEAKGMEAQYDYILVNDTVEECVDHLHEIITAEHSRASRNTEFIADIQGTDQSISEIILRFFSVWICFTDMICGQK